MDRLVENYRGWVALGPGGLPANPLGWVATSILRPIGRDPLDVSADAVATPTSDDDYGVLRLPRRAVRRPTIAPYPIPHREAGPDAPPERVAALTGCLRTAADVAGFHTAVSRFEKRGDALFCTNPGTAWARAARGELAHVHAQGSLHVVAAPDDVREIVGQGWGERHPLAGRLGIPDSYVLLYAPRDDDDQHAVERIIRRVIATSH